MVRFFIIFFFSLFVYACSLERTSTDKRFYIKEQNDRHEMLVRAKDYYLFGQHQDALNTALPLAEQNIPEAQYLVGYLYFLGEGVKRDRTLGRKWMERAADAGYRTAIEALVMIDAGLTPEGKCFPDEEHLTANNIPVKAEKNINNPVYSLSENDKSRSVLPEQNAEPLPVKTVTAASSSGQDKRDTTLGKYTVQLISSQNIDSVRHFLKSLVNSHPSLNEELFIFQNIVKQQVIYAAGYGSYQSYSQAREGLAVILPLLPAESPWIKPLKDSTFVSMYP